MNFIDRLKRANARRLEKSKRAREYQREHMRLKRGFEKEDSLREKIKSDKDILN